MMRTLRIIIIDTMMIGGMLGTREIPIGLGTPVLSALTRRCGKPAPSRHLSSRQVTVSTGAVTHTRLSGLHRLSGLSGLSGLHRLSGLSGLHRLSGLSGLHRLSGLPRLSRMAVVTAGTGGPMKTAREGAWNAREGAWKKKAPTRIAS
jgi:hypothetical protein